MNSQADKIFIFILVCKDPDEDALIIDFLGFDNIGTCSIKIQNVKTQAKH